MTCYSLHCLLDGSQFTNTAVTVNVSLAAGAVGECELRLLAVGGGGSPVGPAGGAGSGQAGHHLTFIFLCLRSIVF